MNKSSQGIQKEWQENVRGQSKFGEMGTDERKRKKWKRNVHRNLNPSEAC